MSNQGAHLPAAALLDIALCGITRALEKDGGFRRGSVQMLLCVASIEQRLIKLSSEDILHFGPV